MVVVGNSRGIVGEVVVVGGEIVVVVVGGEIEGK